MALWKPPDLISATLEAWYRNIDPDGVIGVSADVRSGGVVTDWTDRSGKGRTLVKQGTPPYNANGLATGYPTVGPSFVTASGMAFPSGQPISAFVLGNEPGASGNYRRLVSLNSAGNTDYSASSVIPIITNSVGKGTILYYQNAVSSDKNYDTGTPVIFEGIALTSTTAVAAVNAVQSATIASVSFSGLSMDKLALMDQSDAPGGAGGSYAWAGSVAEAIIVSGVPSSADVARLEGYIAWNNGQQALLPVGHAYRAAPPMNSKSHPIFRRPLRMFTRRF